jgi:hypothetical protein
MSARAGLSGAHGGSELASQALHAAPSSRLLGHFSRLPILQVFALRLAINKRAGEVVATESADRMER